LRSLNHRFPGSSVFSGSASVSFDACCHQVFATQLHRSILRQGAIGLDGIIAESLAHLCGEGCHQRPGNFTQEIPVRCRTLSLQDARFKSNHIHVGKPGYLQESRQYLWCGKGEGTGSTWIRWWELDVPHHDLHRKAKERAAFWRSPGTDSDPTCWFERCV